MGGFEPILIIVLKWDVRRREGTIVVTVIGDETIHPQLE